MEKKEQEISSSIRIIDKDNCISISCGKRKFYIHETAYAVKHGKITLGATSNQEGRNQRWE